MGSSYWSKLVFRSEHGAGDGGNDVIPWDNFPVLVHFKILEKLQTGDLSKLLQTSKSVYDFIEHEYGIPVVVPAPGHVSPCQTHIATTNTVQLILESMEGKRIRTFEMNSMPITCYNNPFPFDRFFAEPRWLRELTLKYVDIRLVNEFLSRCPRLKKFQYKSGRFRHVFQRSRGSAILIPFYSMASTPLKIPPAGRKFMEAIAAIPLSPPNNTVIVQQLTTMTIIMEDIVETRLLFLSDYLNIFYLLLILEPVNLKQFCIDLHFTWKDGDKNMHAFFSALAQFLTRTPNLTQLKYIVRSHHILPGYNSLQVPQLIWNYGTDLTRQVFPPGDDLDWDGRFNAVVRCLQVASRSLANLHDISVDITVSDELDYFIELFRQLPAVHMLKITRRHDGESDGASVQETKIDLLKFLTSPNRFIFMMCQTLRKLSVSRSCCCLHCSEVLPPISKILQKFVVLEDLEFVDSLESDNNGIRLEVEGREENNNCLFRNGTAWNHSLLHDDQTFPVVRSLALSRTAVSHVDVQMLTRFPNLERFHLLEGSASKRTRQFGISSGDLLRILRLRRLNEIQVENVLFVGVDKEQIAKDRQALLCVGEIINGAFKFCS